MKLPVTAAITIVVSLGPPLAALQQQPSAQSIVRLENAIVRVVEIAYAPNAIAAHHTHQYPRAVYVIEPGVLQLVSDRGDTTRVELTVGQTIWRPAETHVVQNVGRTSVRVLETEVKAGTGELPLPQRP